MSPAEAAVISALNFFRSDVTGSRPTVRAGDSPTCARQFALLHPSRLR